MPMVSVQLYQKRKWVRKERGLSSVLARLWLLDTVSCHPPPQSLHVGSDLQTRNLRLSLPRPEE